MLYLFTLPRTTRMLDNEVMAKTSAKLYIERNFDLSNFLCEGIHKPKYFLGENRYFSEEIRKYKCSCSSKAIRENYFTVN